jgi:hypothetical protein
MELKREPTAASAKAAPVVKKTVVVNKSKGGPIDDPLSALGKNKELRHSFRVNSFHHLHLIVKYWFGCIHQQARLQALTRSVLSVAAAARMPRNPNRQNQLSISRLPW